MIISAITGQEYSDIIFDYLVYTYKLLQEQFDLLLEELDLSLCSVPKIPKDFFLKFDKIKTIDCSHNNLEELPDLPESLNKLYCQNNKLTKLPELPKNLTRLDCSSNNLEELPEPPIFLLIKAKLNPGYEKWTKDPKYKHRLIDSHSIGI